MFDFLTPQVIPKFENFSKCDMLQCCDMSHVTIEKVFFTWYDQNIYKGMLYIIEIRIFQRVFKGFNFFPQISRETELCSRPQSVS